jgi:hypothetical protein
MKRAAIGLVLFLGLGAGVGYLATGGFGASDGSSAGSAAGGIAAVDGGGVAFGAPTGSSSQISKVAPAMPAPASGVSEDAAGTSTAVGSGVPAIGPEIVKTAELSVEVKKGTFGSAYDQASRVAATYGGFVESSSTAQGDKSRSGTLLIRVPNANFDQAMSALRGLGTPDSESTSGQDVSGQFVDLEARLRTWEAQETVFLRLMHKAHSVSATLQIQRQLQDVQMQIEQIKGELHQLQDQTRMATINVTVHEPGISIPRPQPVEDTRPNLGEAWSKAVDGLLGVLYTTVVGLGYLLPVAALVALGVFVWRRISVRPVRVPRQTTPVA